ncbi:MAG: metallophosphoesterase family protein [Planctomycetota bacterium]|jgi:3',5'-cyclic AMP phosphodiesterase CpdA
MFRLAHLSDPHVSPLPAVSPRALLNKRLLGFLSWQHRRRHVHKRAVLDALGEDLRAQNPDHVVVTGDLVNISLPAEFEQAAHWLRSLGSPDWVTVIPGNHDAYVAMPWAASWHLWRDYMSSDLESPKPGPPSDFADFPLLRRRGPLAIVGTSSALPTPLGFASGTLGQRQLDALRDHLATLADEDCFRVVLVHHPPLEGSAKHRKRLTDAAEFRQVVAQSGAELVLHGHNHTFVTGEIEAEAGAIIVRGIPSASSLGHGRKPAANYQLFDIEPDDQGWRVTVRVRGYDPATGRFEPAQEQQLLVARSKPAAGPRNWASP